ncbi:MAG: pyruvate ferredoxin oxidoreductase alpha subunit [Acidobacteriota bacterium]|nr:pyruvate ferredoxin oxidoreductase alpha subunit [Acidobacteriota bacterium]
MASIKVLNGNAAVAEAVGQVHPDVVVSNPVAPATPILERIASFIAEGWLDAEIINAESAYSAISACIGASAAGGRVISATASQGLAAMHELLFVASSLRLPIVIAVANRALSAPINIHADHSDAMAQRDCGWIQLFSENSQETYDNIIQAFKIAEHPDVRNPVMVGLDGFITSHEMTNIWLVETGEVTDFVGKCNPAYSLLDSNNPVTVGSLDTPDYYFEHKVNQLQGMENARKVIKEVGKEFGDRFSRYYGYFESYKLEDAEYAIVLMSSAAGAAKEVVDELRSNGEHVGLLKLRVFRPFPHQELKEALSHLEAIAVLDRALIPGSFGGPLFNETRAALYDMEDKNLPLVFPYVYGLGGRDITIDNFRDVFRDIEEKNTEKIEIKTELAFINLRQ